GWRAADNAEHVLAVAELPGEDACRERLEARLPRQVGVKRDEPYGRVEQQWRSVAASAQRERDLRAQPLEPRPLDLVEPRQLCRRQQRFRRLWCPRVQLPVRRREGSCPSPDRIRRQLRRSLQERRRRRDAATPLRTTSRALQLAGHLLVE